MLTMADIQATIQAGIQTGIQAALAAHTTANPTNNPVQPRTNRRSIEGLSPTALAAMGYCWTHGFCKNRLHTSATCTWPNEGHQITATGTNRMGGHNGRYVPGGGGRRNN